MQMRLTLESLRQLVSASEFTVDFALEDLAAINIVASWSFTTQSVGENSGHSAQPGGDKPANQLKCFYCGG